MTAFVRVTAVYFLHEEHEKRRRCVLSKVGGAWVEGGDMEYVWKSDAIQ